MCPFIDRKGVIDALEDDGIKILNMRKITHVFTDVTGMHKNDSFKTTPMFAINGSKKGRFHNCLRLNFKLKKRISAAVQHYCCFGIVIAHLKRSV